MAWQVAWHALLPQPFGARNGWLAAVAALPLLFPLRGVAGLRHGALIAGAFLAIFYFIVGAVEAWSNPAQRAAALVQVLLVAGYLAGVVALSRRPGPPAG